MITGAHVLATVGTLGTAGVALHLVRRHSLNVRYAMLWIALSVSMLVVIAFPGLLDRAATLLSIVEPADALFFLGFLVLFAIVLQLSFAISKLEMHTRTLAEEVALLRLEVETVDRVGHEPDPDAERRRPQIY
ncbi:MAG: DUF2304 domain-containing protein [Actinobacteria bacterium]|jgi:hypothetical protein|nr:DUF2304 domain-containing protein [Actinomycetota bacterium]